MTENLNLSSGNNELEVSVATQGIADITGLQAEVNKIQKLSNATSGLSLGASNPFTRTTHRFALYEMPAGNPSYTAGSFFYGVGLIDNNLNTVGTGVWGGSGLDIPDQGTTPTGLPPHLFVQSTGRVGVGTINPSATMDIQGSLSVTGSISGASKSFDIPHPDPAKAEYRLRHYCVESDNRGGSIQYSRRIQAPKAGVVDLIMPDWFKFLATDIMIFVNGYGHMGTGWGKQDELDGNVMHITVSKGGEYNILVNAARNDHCAKHKCPAEIEYIPVQETPETQNNFPI